MFTEEFFDEAMDFLCKNFPAIHTRILHFEKVQPPTWSRTFFPNNMFSILASSIIHQKVDFKRTTESRRMLNKVVGYMFTSDDLVLLGKSWFMRPELNIEEKTVDHLWNLVEYCQENGDPSTEEDLLIIRKKVKGIGEWTIEVTLLTWSICRVPEDGTYEPHHWSRENIRKLRLSRKLQRETQVHPNLIVSWDPVIRKGLYVLLGTEMYSGAMRQLKKSFGKYGGFVSLYMWWNFNHKKIDLPRTYKDWRLIHPRVSVPGEICAVCEKKYENNNQLNRHYRSHLTVDIFFGHLTLKEI